MEKIEEILQKTIPSVAHSYRIEPGEYFACMFPLKEAETIEFNELTRFVSSVAKELGITTDKVVIALERSQLEIGFSL